MAAQADQNADRNAEVGRIGRVVRRLNPVAIALSIPRSCFGPMFDKEMRAAGRRKGTYVFRSLYVLLVVGAAFVMFIASYQPGAGLTPAQRTQSLQSLAPVITITVLWCQLIFILLLTPVMTCDGIADERRRQTLSTLLSTPITASEIVFGKLSAAIVRMTIVVLASIPVLFAVRVFGGVPARAVLGGACVSMASAFMAAGVGLWISARTRRSTTGALLSLVLVAAMVTLPGAAIAILAAVWDEYGWGATLRQVLGPGAPNWLIEGPSEQMFFASSPLFGMGAVTVSTIDAGGGAVALAANRTWLIASAVTFGAGLFFALAAVADTRRLMTRLADGGGDTAELEKTQRRRDRREQKRKRANRPERSSPIGMRPVLWRELRQPLFARRSLLVVTLLTAAALLGIAYARGGLDETELHIPVGLFGTILIVMQAAIFAAGPIPHEREARSWEVLLTTRETPASIVIAKVVGVVRRLWLIPLIMGVNFACALAADAISPWPIPMYALAILGPVTLMIGTGTLIGMKMRKGLTATILNLLVGFGIWAALPAVCGLTISLLYSMSADDLADPIATLLVATHPLFIPGEVMSESVGSWREPLHDIDVSLPTGSISYGAALAIRFVVTSFEVAAGVGCLILATKRFNRMNDRPS